MGDEEEIERALKRFQIAIEKRVNEQVARHLKVDPTMDPKRAVDIQIKQEQEDLRKIENSDVRRALAAWVSELGRKLKVRR